MKTMEHKIDDGKHILDCESCFQEFLESARDRVHLRKLGVASHPARFTSRRGQISGVSGFLNPTPGTVFRSSVDSKYWRVIHSRLIPMERDYLILEVTGDGREPRIYLERGNYVCDPMGVELLRDGRLAEGRKLHETLEWRIHSLPPGQYSMYVQKTLVLKFSIETE